MTDFWEADSDPEPEPDPGHLDRLRAHIAPLLDGLARHRRAVSRDTPTERARRQQIRAEEVARSLGSTRPSVVRAMLALVIADEHTAPRDEQTAPAPGARAALKPKVPKAKPRVVAKRNTHTDQEALW